MKRVTVRLGTERYPVLDAFVRCRDRVSVIMGPLGSGKTFGCVDRILEQMTEQDTNDRGMRPSRWFAVRNTYPDLTTTTIKDFMALFQDLGKLTMGGLEPPTFRTNARLPDGSQLDSEVTFLALDRDDAVRKIRGSQMTGVWLNETKELSKAVIDMLDLRHGRYPSMGDGGVDPTWHGMLGDTNAWDEDHFLYRLLSTGDPPDGWRMFRQPGGVMRHPQTGEWIANPDAENLHNLPDGYYVRGMAGKDEDWIKVNLANEYGFVMDGRPVHPAYVDSIHCTQQPIEFNPKLPIHLGIDFGRTPAAVIAQFVPALGRLVVIDEFVTEDMAAVDFAPELVRYLKRNYPQQIIGWCDPAGDARGQATNDTPRQILVAEGLPVLPAPSNDVTLRRAALARPLRRLCMDGKPAVLISPRCKTLRKGLAGGFCYRRLKVAGQERYTEEPDKNRYSHVCEGLEYLELGLGEGQEAIKRPEWQRSRGPMQAVADM